MMAISQPIPISGELSRKLASIGFIAMLGVVSLHVPCQCTSFSFEWWLVVFWKNLSCTAVPFFFVVSSFLLAGHMCEAGWWRNAVMKRIRTLLVPYLMWNGIAWLFLVALTLVASKIGAEYGGGDIQNFGVCKWLGVLGLLNKPPQHVHLWYVRMLMIFVIISPLFAVCQHRILGAVVVFVLFLLYGYFLMIGGERISYFWEWFFSLRGMAYLALGVYLRFNPIHIHRKKLLGMFAFVSGIVLLVIINCGWDYAFTWILSIMALLSGIWCLVQHLDISKCFTECVFPIYILHWFVGTILIGILNRTGIQARFGDRAALYFLHTLVCFASSVMLARLLKGMFPRFYKIAFGGR